MAVLIPTGRMPHFNGTEVAEMIKTENSNATDRMKIEINGKKINLIFQNEPNASAAEFIKKTLINAYTMKAV